MKLKEILKRRKGHVLILGLEQQKYLQIGSQQVQNNGESRLVSCDSPIFFGTQNSGALI
jgi:hypothetical protein